jgi:hypothetical protein
MRPVPAPLTADRQPTIHVIATTFEGTRAALATAVPLAKGSGAKLLVVVPCIVPYSVDLDDHSEDAMFFVNGYKHVIERLGGSATIDVCRCRRTEDVVAKVGVPQSIVVLGGPVGRWLTSPEERFANRLTRCVHTVIFVASGRNSTHRRLAAMAPFAGLVLALLLSAPAQSFAQPPRPSNDELLRRIDALEAQILELKALLGPPSEPSSPPASPAVTEDEKVFLNSLQNFRYGMVLDTYYGFNFNRPIGRVNLLRAYDVTSNNFSLSQATAVLETAPDLAAGRRFGARVDLQYGQATETLQGSLSNEPRPWVYRNIFQAYGTYIVPVGTGLTVDFGKWASALGFENNYSKDQFNYSRSYWFNFLPFYHMGARVAYKVNDEATLNYWVTNGTQQTEAFNNFKDQFVGVALQPAKSVSWNIQYYLGQEHPDVQPVQTPGPPTVPTQPGLSVTPVTPYFTGKLHILDSYASWQATSKTALALEGDYVLSRNPAPADAARVMGAAAYIRHQITPKTALALRAEYVRDDGGLFSGQTQSLRETTLTYDYKVGEGFLMRSEWRRDSSENPFFLTDTVNVLKTNQQTATLGLIWWWGTKRGAW